LGVTVNVAEWGSYAGLIDPEDGNRKYHSMLDLKNQKSHLWERSGEAGSAADDWYDV
jgi:hypothetical protein